MAKLVTNPLNRILDANGIPVAGGKAKFYATGTTTPVTVYADAGRTTPLANPVIADSGGLLPNIYLGASTYRIVFTTAADVTIRDVDPFTPAGDSAADISYLAAGTGAVERDVSSKLSDLASAFDYIPPSYHTAILNGSTSQDVTAYLADAVAAEKRLSIPPGLLRITDEIEGISGSEIHFSPNTTLRQYTQGKSALIFTDLSNAWVMLNGGAIRGPGGYNAGGAWAGNSGYEGYRGVRFLGCVQSGINGAGGRVFNFGNAGVEIRGGSDLWLGFLRIEGTHEYGGSIALEGNFQQGVYISNDPTYGGANGVQVHGCNISGVAQGLLREALPTPIPTRGIIISATDFHDIPGQHAVYNQESLMTVVGCRATNIALSAYKSQAADANRDLDSIICTGNAATNIGGALYELAAIGPSNKLTNVRVEGVANGCGHLVSLNGPCRNVRISVSGEAATNPIYCFGADQKSVVIDVQHRNAEEIGVLITSTGSEIEVRPTLENVNTSAGGSSTGDAIRVTSANAVTDATTVIVRDARITDPNGNMTYGIRSSRAQSTIRVVGTFECTGFASGVSVVDAGTLTGIESATGTWSTWTPTIASSSGTLTTTTINHARYWRKDNTVFYALDFTLTDAGTGSGLLNITGLPYTPAYSASLSCTENSTDGLKVAAFRPGSLSTLQIAHPSFSSSIVATGRRFIVSGQVEVA